MQWIERGTRVTYCIVTDGGAGGYDDRLPRQAMADLRRAEQVHSAKLSGVADVRFLGYPDSFVEASVELRRDLCRVIREVRPQRAIIPSPRSTGRGSPTSTPTTAPSATPVCAPSTPRPATPSPTPPC
ncbi:PIG-L family deacetylase [Streptomyces sp. SJL17-4]|uniref:PIG-L deacetylase family protein n=1 Tax=Streptomyces sp. SJL17-4 TaxID=2967224 RepID=UPI0030D0CF1D